jgi:hypothetical protein
MTITIYDRVQETTTTTGTGSITLLGPSAGFVDFNSTVGVGNRTYYGIVDNANFIWEIGIGRLTDSTTLARESVISSTNSNNLIDLQGDPCFVFIDVPAVERVQWPDLGSGAIANVGTSANNVVQLDGSARLPAVDGSQLTNLPAVIPLQTSGDPETIIKNNGGNPILVTDGNGNPVFQNNSGNHIFAMDGNGNPWIYNTQGIDVFSIDGNGNPVISSGTTPGYDAGIVGFDTNLNPHLVNKTGQVIYAMDTNGQPVINNAQGNPLANLDGSNNLQINNTNGNKIFGIDGNGNPFFHNNSGNQTFATDGNGNPWIYNTQGVDVFSIDSNGNPVLSSGNTPGFDTGIFGFDSNLDPHIINNNGQTVFGVDSSTGRPKISNNIYPSDSYGNLQNDGSGNLAWVSRYKTVNAQTGTSYTLTLTDEMVTLFNSSGITLTVPAYSDVNFHPLTEISLVQLGVGQVTVQAAGGVTISSYLNKVNLAGQYAGATLKMISTDSWLLIGNLA